MRMLIKFRVFEGKLVCDPGESGRIVAAPLAKVLGMEMVSSTTPGATGVECSIDHRALTEAIMLGSIDRAFQGRREGHPPTVLFIGVPTESPSHHPDGLRGYPGGLGLCGKGAGQVTPLAYYEGA